MPKQIRVCLVGAGRVARVHANSLVNHVPDGLLAAVIDPAEVNLNITANQFSIDQCFNSLEDAKVVLEP